MMTMMIVFFKAGSLKLWLLWISLCRPHWPRVHRDPPCLLLSAVITGMQHHTWQNYVIC